MKHISFPSITQFRDIIRHIISDANYHNVLIPTVKFIGTVKLHGTNASVVRPLNGTVNDIYCQSRERVITVESDNAGFATWANKMKNEFNVIFERIKLLFPEYSDCNNIQIYGEWAGKGIQKGVGINNIPPSFFVFGIRVSQDALSNNWLSKGQIQCVMHQLDFDKIYCIFDFKTWEIDIDFNQPHLAQNKLIELTNEVENVCPVSKQLIGDTTDSLIGEGIVYTSCQPIDYCSDISNLRFKVKGEKHSSSKVKTIVELDVEKVNSIAEFVDTVVTENRLQQGIVKLGEMGVDLSIQNIGTYIKWVTLDSIKENTDLLSKSNLTTKDITRVIVSKSRKWFIDYINSHYLENHFYKTQS